MEEEELWSDDDDVRADDTADASTVATTLVAACAPDCLEIVEQRPLPDVADRTDLKKLVGQIFMPLMMSTMRGILTQSQALVSDTKT